MCRTGCPTPGFHASWGECARDAGIQAGAGLLDRDVRRAHDAELSAYASARAEGIQPKGTTMKQVEQAKWFADTTGIGNPWQSR